MVTAQDIASKLKKKIIRDFELGTEYTIKHSYIDFRTVNLRKKMDYFERSAIEQY
jgi:hypothetical protein